MFSSRSSWYRNCLSLARYFAQKHQTGEGNQQLLERARKKVPAPEPHTQKGMMTWAQVHQFEVVGFAGGYDTPVDCYIQETRDSWKQRNFSWGPVVMNRPRWMERLRNYYQEQERLSPEVLGGNLGSLLSHPEEWNTREYDYDRQQQRLLGI